MKLLIEPNKVRLDLTAAEWTTFVTAAAGLLYAIHTGQPPTLPKGGS